MDSLLWKYRMPCWPIPFTLTLQLSITAILLVTMINSTQASGSVPPSGYPLTVPSSSGTLTYYGAADGYLNYVFGVPVGFDEAAVAWATVTLKGYSTVGFAKTGSGIYGGAHYSLYKDSINAYPYVPTYVVTQYVCPEGNNGSPTWYTGSGMTNSRNEPNECCPCGYTFDAVQRMCILSNTAACPAHCPANSTAVPVNYPTTCTCIDGYTPDSAGTSCVPAVQCQPPDVIDPATRQCVHCTVDALTPLPDNDACTQALENLSSTQAQKDAACGTLSQEMQDGKACLEKKLSSLGTPIPLSVGVGVRSDAYQKHFVDIWNQMEKLVNLEDPIMQAACAARRAEVAAEKGCDNAGRCVSCSPPSASQRSHCLKGRPSSSNTAPHTQGNAIDVSESSTIKPLRHFLQARKPPQDIQQFLDESPDCKLKWGGIFTDNYDPIHFQVR